MRGLFLIVLLNIAFEVNAQDIADTATCMECHSDEELFGEINGNEVLVFIDQNRFEQSVHADFACIDCHDDIEEEIHSDELKPVDCAMCHEDQGLEIASSVHTPAERNQCATCHGNAHYIVPRDQPESLITSNNINSQCLSCHTQDENNTAVSEHTTETSFHLTKSQADGTPINCSHCHGSHAITALDDANSPISQLNAQTTCGACHAEEQQQFERSIHGQNMALGSDDAATCTSCHYEHQPQVTALSQRKIEIHNTCGSCHFDEDLMNGHGLQMNGFETLMDHSVHSSEVRKGNVNAPVCSDCHGYHEILALNDPESTVYFQNVSSTCGKCHEEVQQQYEISIHGVSSARGRKDSPICTDCHGEHSVLRAGDELSPVHQLNMAKSTCARCHDSVALSSKYGMDYGQVESYFDSYHGLANNWGSQQAANCGSCHGFHMILPSTDPRSTISPTRLAETCGQCHQGMSSNVVLSPVHSTSGGPSNTLAAWVKWLYIILIVVVVGGMFLHNTLIYLSILRKKHQQDSKKQSYKRFNGFEIFCHAVLSLSFILLVVSGFALVFTDSWWVGLLAQVGFTEEIRALLHRISGVALIVVSVAYALYLLFTKRGWSELYHFAPTFTDVKHAFQNIAYYLGYAKSEPEYGRYDYTEKMEFWALVWGVIIMAVTGLFLWFPVWVLEFMPKWVLDVSEVIHFYEAVLAALAILIWHLYFVMYHPDEYPMNTSWIDGKMTVEKLKHRHPKEYESWKKEQHAKNSMNNKEEDMGDITQS